MSERRKSSVVSVNRDKDDVRRISDAAVRRLSVVPDAGQQAAEAKLATDAEKALTVRQAIKLYKTGIAFSLIMSLAVIMEGYDLSITGSFLGYDQFRQAFGTETDPDGNPRISAAWQSGVLNGVQAGSIIGLYLNGYVSEWIGYKKTMYGSIILAGSFNLIHFFAQNIGQIVAGAVLLGIPYGVFQTITVTYASDIMPSTLRPYLTTYINLCWVMGQLVASGVLRGCQTLDSEWGWRIPFAIQWFWLPWIFIGAWFAPESPWWLVRKGRYDDARASLARLTNANAGVPFNIDHGIALMKYTNELEKATNGGVGYSDCFKGVEARRTLIACVVWLTQAFCGAAMMGFSVQIFREAGLSEENGLNMNIGQYALGFVGTLTSWFLMKHIGRRALYVWGLAGLFCFLMVIGGLGVISQTNDGAAWALGSILLVYTYVYNCTVGPVCYAIVSEIPSTRVKIKTVVLARNVYNIGGIVNNIIVPKMLSPQDWNWAGKTGFFFAGLTIVLAIFMYLMLPECKGRTYAELDVLFENKVSARKFHKTDVDQFAGHNTNLRMDDSESEKTLSGNEKAASYGREQV